MSNTSKNRTIHLLKYLWLHTDENHTATVSDIQAYLKSEGIDAHRTTVTSDINDLIDLGIDIICIRSTQNHYFIGSRVFEIPELKMLTDAVSAAKFISENKSRELVDKIASLASEGQKKELIRHLFVTGQPKTKNETVYYIVDMINQAINNEKRITFQYFEYLPDKLKVLKHDGYIYEVSPYSFAWNGDNYYLIGFSEKHEGIVNFRVDRMTNVKIINDVLLPKPTEFNVADYCAKLFLMYGGDEQTVELICENCLMKTIIDRFGEDVDVEKTDDEHFKATVKVIPGHTFYAWVFNYAGKMRIISPESIVMEFRSMISAFE